MLNIRGTRGVKRGEGGQIGGPDPYIGEFNQTITSIFFDEDERVPLDFCFQRVLERILKGSRRRREIGEKSLRGGKVGPQELRAGRNDERFHKVSNGLGGYSSKSARSSAYIYEKKCAIFETSSIPLGTAGTPACKLIVEVGNKTRIESHLGNCKEAGFVRFGASETLRDIFWLENMRSRACRRDIIRMSGLA
uniref:Uncharacterized protein n=1 Tax=Vespula pensylvanica TaxID=30213 RepID=A0A834UBE6_VESPE|nr:hypothetical protein H0235_007212 [Vespula pensylvanica]